MNSQDENRMAELSVKHVNIPGTNVSFIPPTEFVLSENFKGFQDPDDNYSMIMVMELPAPFREVSKGFTDEMLSPRGMTMTSKEEGYLGSLECIIIEMKQDANGATFEKTIIIYGDDDKTSIVNGVWLEGKDEVGKKINESVLTIHIDENSIPYPRKELDFTLDEHSYDLQFHSVIGNGMLFNRDGKIPTESNDQLNVIIDKSFAEMEIMDKKQFCIDRIVKLPGVFKFNEPMGLNPIEIDNLKGYDLVAQNKYESKEELYQAILFLEDGGYYIYVATYHMSNPKALEDATDFLKSFKRKL